MFDWRKLNQILFTKTCFFCEKKIAFRWVLVFLWSEIYNEFIRSFMKIYKFGGASVKDASAVNNVTSIISRCKGR